MRCWISTTRERTPELHADFLQKIAAVLGMARIHGHHFKHDPLMFLQQFLECLLLFRPRMAIPSPRLSL
jgi:hypothetical protein